MWAISIFIILVIKTQKNVKYSCPNNKIIYMLTEIVF